MTAIAKPIVAHFHLPRINLRKLFGGSAHRRQSTIDLINSSPHLKRDIGALEEHFTTRRH